MTHLSIPRHAARTLLGLALTTLILVRAVAQTPFTLHLLSPSGKALDSIALHIAFPDKTTLSGYTDREGLFRAVAPEGCSQAHLWAWGKGFSTLETTLNLSTKQEHTLRLPIHTLPGIEVLRSHPEGGKSIEADSYRITPHSLPTGAGADEALRRLPGIVLTDEGCSLIGAPSTARLYVNEIPANISFVRSLHATDLDRVEVRYRDVEATEGQGAIYITLRQATTSTLRGDLLASAGILRPEYRLHPSLALFSSNLDLRLFSAISYSHLNPETRLYQSGSEILHQTNKDKDLHLALGGMVNLYLSPELQGSGSLILKGSQHRGHSIVTQPQRGRVGSLREDDGGAELSLLLAYRPTSTQRLLLRTRGIIQGNAFTDLSNQRYSLSDLSVTTDLVYEHRDLWFLDQRNNLTFTLSQQGNSSHLYGIGTRYWSTQLRLVAQDELQLSRELSATLSLGIQWGQYGLGAGRQYVIPLPTLAIRYTRWGYTGRLSYSRYAEHPSAELLSPSPYYLNELEQILGDPMLRHQTTDLVQLSLSRRFGRHALSLSTSYRHLSRLIAAQLTEPTVDHLAFANVGSGHLTDLTLRYHNTFLEGRLSVQLYTGMTYSAYLLDRAFRRQTRGRSSIGWELRSGGEVSYTLREGWLCDLGVSYHSPRYLFSRRRMIDPLIQLGVQKQLLEGKLNVSLRAKAPFGLGEQMQEKYYQRLHAQSKEVRHSLWNISLGLTYHFDQSNEKGKPQLPPVYPDHTITRRDMKLR